MERSNPFDYETEEDDKEVTPAAEQAPPSIGDKFREFLESMAEKEESEEDDDDDTDEPVKKRSFLSSLIVPSEIKDEESARKPIEQAAQPVGQESTTPESTEVVEPDTPISRLESSPEEAEPYEDIYSFEDIDSIPDTETPVDEALEMPQLEEPIYFQEQPQQQHGLESLEAEDEVQEEDVAPTTPTNQSSPSAMPISTVGASVEPQQTQVEIRIEEHKSHDKGGVHSINPVAHEKPRSVNSAPERQTPERPTPRRFERAPKSEPLKETYSPDVHDRIPPRIAFEKLTGIEQPQPRSIEQERRHEVKDDPSAVSVSYTQPDHPQPPTGSTTQSVAYDHIATAHIPPASTNLNPKTKKPQSAINQTYKNAVVSGLVTAAVVLACALLLAVLV